MYGLADYGYMITDQVRTGAYVKALRATVKPGSAVLDLGTGTGIFALLACQFGARRVYAVEPNDCVQLAKKIAVANGFMDRIEFIQDVSLRTTLPEKADTIVTDMRGVLPFYHENLRSIIDARQRLLKPNGTLIPQIETLWAAVAEVPDLYRLHLSPWNENPHGFDMKPALEMVTNQWRRARLKPEQLLSEPKSLAILDYASLESPNLKGKVCWIAGRAGLAHGITVWFDSVLADGVEFSNAPGKPELIYGNAFFPWPKPVILDLTDTISFELMADLVGTDHVWRWNTTIRTQDKLSPIKARFNQSSFLGEPLSPDRLRKSSEHFVPHLNMDGRIDAFIVKLMGEGISLGDIASQVLNQFSAPFSCWKDALTRVGKLSQKYSQ